MAHRPGASQHTLARRLKRQRSKLQNQVELSQVLGLTCYNDNALCIGKNAECVVYPAGCAVVLYHPKTNKQSHIINPSRKPISSLCLSSDNKFLAFGECGHNPCIHVWDISSYPYSAAHQLRKHSFGISCVAFSPNMRYLVSVGYQHDQTIHVWNWRGSVTVATNKITSKVCGLDFSADGTYFVTVGNRRVRYWYFDTTGKDGKLNAAHPLKGHSAILGEHQNNCFVTVACGRGLSSSHTYTLTKSGLLCLFNNKRHLQKCINVKGGFAHCLLASNEHVMCGCSDGIVRLFHPLTLDLVAALPKPHPLGVNLVMASEAGYLGTAADSQCPDTTALSFDPSSNMMAVVYNDHSLYLWDVSSTGEIEKACSSLYHNACVWDVCPSPTSNENESGHAHRLSFVTCSSDNTVRFWQLHKEGNLEPAMNIYSKDAFCVVYTDSDISFLKDTSHTPGDASAVHDSNRGVRCLKLHPQGLHLAIGDRIGNLRVYQLKQLRDELIRVEAHDAEVLSLDYSPPSTKYPLLLATSSRDRLVHVFRVDQNYTHLQTLCDHSAAVTAVKFAVTKGNLVLLSCGVDKSVMFQTYVNLGPEGWHFQRSQHIACKSSLYAMAIDPTMEQVAVVGQDKILRIFSIATGKLQMYYNGNDTEEAAYLINLAVDPSGLYVAVSGSDKAVCVFNFRSGECLARLHGHSEVVTSLSFSPDCRHLFSVSGDSCVFVWKMPKELVQSMHSRLIELGMGPSLSRLEHSTQLRRETYSVPEDGKDLTVTTDGEDGDNFRYSFSKLPTWARNQISTKTSVEEEDGIHSTANSKLAGGKWAESAVSPTALFGEVVNSPGSGESETECEEVIPELVKAASSDQSCETGDLLVNDLTGEDEHVGDSSGDSELIISSIEGCVEGSGSSPEHEETGMAQTREVDVSPMRQDLQADSSHFVDATPEKHGKDVQDVIEDPLTSTSSSSSSTPDIIQKELADQDAFLKANFVSLSAEKVDHFFNQPTGQANPASSRRVTLSARFLNKSLRKEKSITPLAPPAYPPSPELPGSVSAEQETVDAAGEVRQQGQTETISVQEVLSSTAIKKIHSSPSREQMSPGQEVVGEALSIAIPRPKPKSLQGQKSGGDLETEITKARKRLEELGYELPGKQHLPGQCLSQTNDNQSPASTPAVETQPLVADCSFAGEDGAASIQLPSEHDQHLQQALALAEQISLAFSNLREAVEKTVETRVEEKGEEEDALTKLTQAVHDLGEQCDDIKRMLPGKHKHSPDDADMQSMLSHYSELLVLLVQDKLQRIS